LRRRAAMTARPARVRIRSRKPWTFARRRLFGWNVRLLTGAPGCSSDQLRIKANCHAPRRRVSLLTVKGIPAQVKLSAQVPQRPLSAGPLSVYHRWNTAVFERIPPRRLRLWKINVHRPVNGARRASREGKPRRSGGARGAPRYTGVRSALSAHMWTALWTNERGR
jgi:hypothetical protein